jgi:hypothetical protein
MNEATVTTKKEKQQRARLRYLTRKLDRLFRQELRPMTPPELAHAIDKTIGAILIEAGHKIKARPQN